MVLAYHDIMEVARVLSEDRNMVVTVKESGKGALVTGGVAGLGKSSCSLHPDQVCLQVVCCWALLAWL